MFKVFLPDGSRLAAVVIVVVAVARSLVVAVLRSLAVHSLVAGGRLFVVGGRLLVSVTRSRNMRTVSLVTRARRILARSLYCCRCCC